MNTTAVIDRRASAVMGSWIATAAKHATTEITTTATPVSVSHSM